MVSKETEKKLAQLQLLEENLNHISMKKQEIQTEEFEIKNALEELDKTSDIVYKIVGQIMIRTDKEDLKKELEFSRETNEIKLKSIEKQESILHEKIKIIQADVMELLKSEKKNE